MDDMPVNEESNKYKRGVKLHASKLEIHDGICVMDDSLCGSCPHSAAQRGLPPYIAAQNVLQDITSARGIFWEAHTT